MGLGLDRERGLKSLLLDSEMGEEEKDGQKAAVLKEDVELDREEAKDDRLNKVRTCELACSSCRCLAFF